MNEVNNTTESAAVQPDMPLPMGGASAAQALAPITIYMTKKDYSNLVLIGLSADRGSVVSYPAPSDLKLGDGYSTPIALKDGYYWDRRGLGLNSAFISMSYAEYAALDKAPTPEELMKLLVDTDPFIELIHCDRSYFDQVNVASLNEYIEEGLPGAKRLKK